MNATASTSLVNAIVAVVNDFREQTDPNANVFHSVFETRNQITSSDITERDDIPAELAQAYLDVINAEAEPLANAMMLAGEQLA